MEKPLFELVWMTYDGMPAIHAEHFAASNPGIPQHTNQTQYAGPNSVFAWRNSDLQIRGWWRDHRQETTADTIIMADPDTLITHPITDHMLPPEGWGVPRKAGKGWTWWRHMRKLGDLREHATGIHPLAVTVWRRNVLDDICLPRFDEVYRKDMQGELRTPTVVTASGHAFYILPWLSQVVAPAALRRGFKLNTSVPGVFNPVRSRFNP